MTVAELYALIGFQVDKGSLKDAQSALQSLARMAQRYIAGEAVQAVVRFAEHAAETGTHILGMSKSLGLSTDAFQKWSLVAQRAGSDGTQFATGVSMFERNLLEFSKGRGSKRFKDAMDVVGISVAESKQLLAGPDGVTDALLKVSDAYHKGSLNAKTAAINTGLFGQRARGMIQDLSQGPESIRAQFAHFKEIGAIVDEKKLKDLKAFNNGLQDIKTAFGAIAMQAVAALAPALTRMAEAAAKWIAANGDLISGALEAALTAVSTLFQGIALAVKFVGDTIRGAFAGDDGAIAILAALAYTVGAVLIPVLWGMVAPIVAATLPFVAIGVLVGALVLGIIKLGEHITDIEEAIAAFGDKAGEVLQSVIDFFEGFGHSIVQGLEETWANVKQDAEDAFNFIVNLPVLKQLLQAIHYVGSALTPTSVEDMSPEDARTFASVKSAYFGADSLSSVETAAMNPTVNAAPGGSNVSIGDIHIENHGVKDAAEASEKMGDELENRLRHAQWGTGGVVR